MSSVFTLLFVALLTLTYPVEVASLALTPSSSSSNGASSDGDIRSWRATSGTSASARVVFSAPSSMDPAATVEVKERSGGWRTVGLVGGTTKSIYHGIYKVDENGVMNAKVLVAKHLQTMVAVAFASIEANTEQPSFLYLGLGAGSLSAFMHHYFQDSHHVAVELDEAVVSATKSIRLKDFINIQIGDALEYRRKPSEEPFDCVFIDIFDDANLLPCEFYSEQFVSRLRDDILKPSGVLVHNFHTGNKKLAHQLDVARDVFTRCFGTCFEIDSLDSKPNAGNTILVGSDAVDLACSKESIGETITAAATDAQKRFGFEINTTSILAYARQVPSQ